MAKLRKATKLALNAFEGNCEPFVRQNFPPHTYKVVPVASCPISLVVLGSSDSWVKHSSHASNFCAQSCEGFSFSLIPFFRYVCLLSR